MLPGEKLSAPAMKIKWAGPKAGPFQGRQATEVNFAGASEASGGPCGEFFFVEKASATTSSKRPGQRGAGGPYIERPHEEHAP